MTNRLQKGTYGRDFLWRLQTALYLSTKCTLHVLRRRRGWKSVMEKMNRNFYRDVIFPSTAYCRVCCQQFRMTGFISERCHTGNHLPPPATDRGYAWLVLAASVVVDMISSATYLVGIFLVEFKHYFGISATRVSLVGALQHFLGMIMGGYGLKKKRLCYFTAAEIMAIISS